MAIEVNLRIVGIYFNSGDVTVSAPDNPTVSQIMEEASVLAEQGAFQNVSGISFVPENPEIGSGQDMSSVSVIYDSPFQSPSGTNLDSGVYQLQDTDGNPYTVLQYYVFDENFVQVNRNNEFIPFSDEPTSYTIQDGYTIIWRQVSIASGPIASAKIASRARKASKRIAKK